MIRISSIAIHNFRGIRQLALEFGAESFVVSGPNGTGKSGVVDAIEFGLTGSITRLSGRGSGKVSVKSHGPHVDARDKPDTARVVLSVVAPSLGKEFTIERNVRDARTPTLNPDSADIRQLLATVERHPEFALSRREIIKYIMVEPGQRAKDVQALLKLDHLEKLRARLLKSANRFQREAEHAGRVQEAARSALLRALDISELRDQDITAAVNVRRALLGVPPIPSAKVSFRDGLATAETAAKAAKVNKATGLRQIEELKEALEAPLPGGAQSSLDAVLRLLGELTQDLSVLRQIRLESFLRRGVELITDEECPFCGSAWESVALRAYVLARLEATAVARKIVERLRVEARPLASYVEDLIQRIGQVRQMSKELDGELDTPGAAQVLETLHRLLKELEVEEPQQLTRTLQSEWRASAPALEEMLRLVRARLEALPEQSAQVDAQTYLALAEETRLNALKARAAIDRWKSRQKRAQLAYEAFASTCDSALEALYRDVEKDFVSYYTLVNGDDEAKFSAELRPSMGKLGFDVDFYGRGSFPPGAYHSEGHQDAMGLCLYLALMKGTLGEEFTICVLDDVLMSIDAGHRREVCRLLRERFPTTQFILTTHDEHWRQHLVTEGVVTADGGVTFRKWSVDDGPQVGFTDELWADIEKRLENDGVPPAAHALRRGLEFVFGELATKLRARIEMRADNRWDLGDLMPAVISRWSDILKRGKAAAQSWGKQEEFEALNQRHEQFQKVVTQSQYEQWAINAAVHYNNWENLSPQEFQPVVLAFRALVDSLRCDACNGLVAGEPRAGQGSLAQARCFCGALVINLNKKPQAA